MKSSIKTSLNYFMVQKVKENLKHIKPHENEEEFWRDLKILSMVGERNDVESLRAELRN